MSPNFNKLTLSLICLVFLVSACAPDYYPTKSSAKKAGDKQTEIKSLTVDSGDLQFTQVAAERAKRKILEVTAEAVLSEMKSEKEPNFESKEINQQSPHNYGINWTEAKYHVGEFHDVCGPVVNSYYASNESGEPTFLDIGNPYPKPNRFTVIIWGKYRPYFQTSPESYYQNKAICVSGLIKLHEGVSEIEVTTPSQISIQNEEMHDVKKDSCKMLFPECLLWNELDEYAGYGETCIIGQVNRVYYYVDENTQMNVWEAFFDPRAAECSIDNIYVDTQGLRLVSVEKDISNFEGKCVLVFILPSADLDEAYGYRTLVNMDEDAGEYGLHQFDLIECPCPYD